jgi:NAD(P)H-dependent FMN reductase
MKRNTFKVLLFSSLIDIRKLPIPLIDARPNAKIPGFSEVVQKADGLIIVTPEYNHTYPGMLKHVLDLNYKEYLHKAVGVCSVSAGSFGGVRAVEALLPTLKAFGLGTIVTDSTLVMSIALWTKQVV